MRAVAGHALLELHFSSPSDMNEQLAPCLGGQPLRVPSGAFDAPPLPGDAGVQEGRTLEVVIHVPWLGRRLRMRGVLAADQAVSGGESGSGGSGAPSPAGAGIHVRLLDGDWNTMAELAEVIGKVASGSMLEPDAGESNPEKRILAMSPSLRALLAHKANPAERLVLARDPDPRVVEMLLRNPSLTLDEARRLATRTSLTQSHFQQIVRHKAWMTDEMMRLTLARNPRLPEFIAETVLPLLALPALKALATSPNTTSSTRRVAVRILQRHGISVSIQRPS